MRVTLAVSTNPHVIHMVDENAVIRLWPHIVTRLGPRSTPAINQIALLIENHNRRTRLATFAQRRVLRQTNLGRCNEVVRCISVHNPNIVLSIDINTNGWAH